MREEQNYRFEASLTNRARSINKRGWVTVVPIGEWRQFAIRIPGGGFGKRAPIGGEWWLYLDENVPPGADLAGVWQSKQPPEVRELVIIRRDEHFPALSVTPQRDFPDLGITMVMFYQRVALEWEDDQGKMRLGETDRFAIVVMTRPKPPIRRIPREQEK
ncbi:MAG: hypothetical protein JJU36_12125 [Phycisphaeraceae bacterium]|nr:hypothetical protein [Phycisphaeraceae bacterium]